MSMVRVSLTDEELVMLSLMTARNVDHLNRMAKAQPKLAKKRSFTLPKDVLSKLQQESSSGERKLPGNSPKGKAAKPGFLIQRKEAKFLHNLLLERIRMMMERTLPEYENRARLDPKYHKNIADGQIMVKNMHATMKKIGSKL